MFKNAYRAARSMAAKAGNAVSQKSIALGAGTLALAESGLSQAAIDPATVVTTLETAAGSADTVGNKVIAVVAGLVVVGVIIALVRKV